MLFTRLLFDIYRPSLLCATSVNSTLRLLAGQFREAGRGGVNYCVVLLTRNIRGKLCLIYAISPGGGGL
jgi:hypothetical protein